MYSLRLLPSAQKAILQANPSAAGRFDNITPAPSQVRRRGTVRGACATSEMIKGHFIRAQVSYAPRTVSKSRNRRREIFHLIFDIWHLTLEESASVKAQSRVGDFSD